MMKLYGKLYQITFCVEVEKTWTVADFGAKVIERYQELYQLENPNETICLNLKVRLVKEVKSGSLLNLKDKICNLVKPEDFIDIVLEGTGSVSASTSPPFPLPEEPERPIHAPTEELVLDGESLTPSELVSLGERKYRIKLSETAIKRVSAARAVVDNVISTEKVTYGINTGFGKFSKVIVHPDNLSLLQLNLIRSHAVGVGEPLTLQQIRMLFALRINVLAKGFSGISPETLQWIVNCFNKDCLSYVPTQGTVGASGDLAPLAHLTLGFIGEGYMWSSRTGWASSDKVLRLNGLKPLVLKSKEGLSFINGTQLITAITCQALERAKAITIQADVITAMTLEGVRGLLNAFDADVHNARPHKGQGECARRVRSILNSKIHPSSIAQQENDRVQDAYSIRCTPQVNGIVMDTLKFAEEILTRELNSATDNPIVLSHRNEIISGGNFHGEYPAKAADYITIAISELSSISERRIERLVNPHYSDLPAFLVENGGLNSGYMIAHVTAASLVSENKVLTHPASSDSISTNAGTEDHVSMGGFAARKALQVTKNVEFVLAIELLCACQAVDLQRPLKTTEPLQKVLQLIRSHVPYLDKDRFLAPEVNKVAHLLFTNQVWKVVEPYYEAYLKFEQSGK